MDFQLQDGMSDEKSAMHVGAHHCLIIARLPYPLTHLYNESNETPVVLFDNVWLSRSIDNVGTSMDGSKEFWKSGGCITRFSSSSCRKRAHPGQCGPSTKNQGNNHGIPWGNNQGRNQFFQGASHDQNPPPAYQALAYQALVHQPPIPQPQVMTTIEFTNYMKVNDAIHKNMETNMTSLTNSYLELKNMFVQFMKMNTASSSGLETLPSNTITNPKEDLKGITTRSGTAYQGPTIPTTSSSYLPKVVERKTEVIKDTVPPTNNGSTKYVQPPVVQIKTHVPNSEPIIAPVAKPVATPVSALKPNQKSSIPYPSRLYDQKLRDKTKDQKEKFLKIFQDLNFNISFADALILMPKFGPSIK
nr:reverse transcriptase domain-containing protein [Tanacetum cinerariifolium]